VGKNEHSPPDMSRTKIRSRKLKSGAVEPSAAQTIPHLGFPSRVAGGLLHDNPFRRQFNGDSEHGWPECLVIALAVDRGGNARFLARWATDDEVRATASRVQGSDVFMNGHPREFQLQQCAALRIDFAKTNGWNSCGGEPQRVAADIREHTQSR
jgi:hypothetical protein